MMETNRFGSYEPQVPPPLAERLVVSVPEGYVKVSTEGERILEPVTTDKTRLDMLVVQYGDTLVLKQIEHGYEVYVPEIFARGIRRDDN